MGPLPRQAPRPDRQQAVARAARSGAASPSVDGSRSGRAALSSAISTARRASSPSRTAVSASASSSIVRISVAGPIVAACACSRAASVAVTTKEVGHLAGRLGDQQVAQVGEQVAGELGRVAARARHPLDPEQHRLRVLGDDRVDGVEEQVGVGGAEHLQHVVELDVLAAEGDQLVERAERVAEAAGGGAGDHRHARRRRSRSTRRRRPGSAPRRSAPARAAGSRSAGSGRRSSPSPCGTRWWRGRRRCSAAAPRASSGRRSRPPWSACGPRRGCRPSSGRRRARRRPARAGRGRRRPSGWRRRPSRSRRSRCRRRSSRQDSHSPHGVTVGPPLSQLSERARIFAIEVLPVPREPTNR